MRLRTDHTQIMSSAKAGLSVATGRRTEGDPRVPSAKKQRRSYRTRPDPLADLWDEGKRCGTDRVGFELTSRLGAEPATTPLCW